MSNRTAFSIQFAILIAVGCGPGQQGPERLPTVPVTGTVLVDKLPATELAVTFHNVKEPVGVAEIYAAKPKATTGGDGAFAMSTYVNGDGVAAGEYIVTFEWRKFDRVKNGYSGPDQLGGQFSDPAKSNYTVTVTGDEEQGIVLDPFELSTK